MDSDLDTMSREQMIAEVQRLRDGIRKHRDSTVHELCWHHPELWGLLPLAMSFMARRPWRNVVRYAQCDAVRNVGLRGIAGDEWHRMRAA